jgi:CheY-like chemotaxis protein
MPGGGTLRFAVNTVARDAMPNPSDLPDVGRLVCVEVSDTGSGMDELTSQRIFEPFFTTKESGTGMGLSAVYGTTKSHGGTVRVRTALDAGTTFELILPGVEQTASAPRPVSSPSASRSALELSILVAEDEGTVLAATTAMLQALGCSVISAKNGREAIEAFREHSDVDVILLDRMMPVMTGDQAIAHIRERDPRSRIILASGYADLPIDAASPDENVIHLRKPFTLGELEEALRQALCVPPLAG